MHLILIADHATRDARNDLADRSIRFSEATLLRLALDEPQRAVPRRLRRGGDNFDQVWREATDAADARVATPIRAEVTWRYVLARDPEANIRILGYSRTGPQSRDPERRQRGLLGRGPPALLRGRQLRVARRGGGRRDQSESVDRPGHAHAGRQGDQP